MSASAEPRVLRDDVVRSTSAEGEGETCPAKPLELRALFEANYAAIWRLLRRLGVHPAHVDDAAQEVFWVAARRLADIQIGRERSFLHGVALRVASRAVRQQRSALPLAEQDDVSRAVDETPSAHDQLERQCSRALLDAVLDHMTVDLRSVFVLYELEELEIREIAALHEIPLGTASSRLRRAREEFAAIAHRLAAIQARVGGR